jgi:hypothetical protein
MKVPEQHQQSEQRVLPPHTPAAAGPVRTPAEAALRLQRMLGNRAATRLLQRTETAVPTVRFSVRVTRAMDARELLVEFAVQSRSAEGLTRRQAEAGIASGEIYWVDDHGDPIPIEQGPTVSAEDVAQGYKLLTRFAVGVTPMSGEELENLRKEFWALDEEDEAEINEQTNAEFWEQTSYKVGERLDPKHDANDALMAQDWLRLRAHIVERRAEYLAQPANLRRTLWEMTPPDVRPFLFSEKGQAELHPKDFDTALRVAQRIAGLSAAERAEYLARVQGTTTDWRQFEASIELYMTERELRGEVAEEREGTMTALFGLDDLYVAYTEWLDALAMRGQRGGAMAIWSARRALEDAMRPHGFESIDEVHGFFEPRIAAFEQAFETEALLVADEMLDRYRHVLWVEKERLLEPEELKMFFGEVTAAGDDLEPLAERWPLLRDEELRDDLEGVMNAPRALEIVLFHISETRRAIAETERNLREDPDLIYGFDVLFDHAMAAEGVQSGSIYHRIVLRRKEQIEDDERLKSIMLAILAVAAGLLTGGGGTVAVIGAATAAAISAYQVLEEFRRYEMESAAHDAGLLSDDPTVAWLIVAVVGAGLDLAAAAKAVRSLATAARTFDETGDVVRLTAEYDDVMRSADADARRLLQEARARVLAAAEAEAQYRHAWRQVLLPAHRINDVLSATGESFGRLVYAVYATIKYHSRSLGAFLKTREARALLGDLALNPSAHKGELAALREGFLSALDAQEKLVQHGLELGLRADELDFWFATWSRSKGSTLEDMLRQLDEYAATGSSKYRSGRGLVTDAESLKHLGDSDMGVAGRGGVERITARKTKAGERVVTVEGRLLEGFGDRAKDAPNFNKTSKTGGSLFTAEELGLKSSDWEWAHLWGPGFGDEAAAGLMLAPRSVNQVAQNRGIEGYMRELGKRARAAGGDVRVKATATSWGNPTPSGWVPPKGADFLQRADYTITLDLPGRARQEIRVTLHVDEPPFKGWHAETEPTNAFDLNEFF